MLFNLHRRQAVFPFESSHLNAMARRWGIRPNDLTEAILQTGSLRRSVIRNYLAKKGLVFTLNGLFYHTRKRFGKIISKMRDDEY
jgi:hypothetical protein